MCVDRMNESLPEILLCFQWAWGQLFYFAFLEGDRRKLDEVWYRYQLLPVGLDACLMEVRCLDLIGFSIPVTQGEFQSTD